MPELRDLCENLDDILCDLKKRIYHDHDLLDLEKLQHLLQRSTEWIEDVLRKTRDEDDDDLFIDTSLTLIPDSIDDGDTTPTTAPTPLPSITAPLTTKSTETTTPTYANSPDTDRSTAARPPNGRLKQPDTGIGNHHSTKHQKRRRARPQYQRPTTNSQPSMRLVVRFPSQPIPSAIRPHPATFRDELNKAINMHAIKSIEYSRSGRLILHTCDPYTADQLASHSDKLWPVIQAALRIGDTPHQPILEPSGTWDRIVIHRVPLPVWDNKKNLQATREEMSRELCRTNLLSAQNVRRVHWLCTKEDEETRVCSSTAASPTYVSIMVALSGPSTATSLRKQGAVLFGAHCRVTDYKERTR